MEQSDEFKRKIHYTMAFIGGFMGAYALLVRCDVFGNAQTSNMIHFAMSIIGRDFADIVIRAGGILLYMAGVALVVFWKKKFDVNVHFVAVTVDVIALAVLGFLPDHMNNVLALYPVFFAAAVQWTSFPGVFGYNCSTIFSTNNLKQFTMASTEYIMEHDSKQAHKAKFYAGTLICYHLGVAGACIACKVFDVRAAWIGFVPVAVALAMIVYENVDLGEMLVFVKMRNRNEE